MQVQANEVLDKMSTRLGFLIKEIVILETHNEMLSNQLNTLMKENEELKQKLKSDNDATKIENTSNT